MIHWRVWEEYIRSSISIYLFILLTFLFWCMFYTHKHVCIMHIIYYSSDTYTYICTYTHFWVIKSMSGENWRRQWHPTPVLLPGKSMGGGAWWAAVHGVAKSRTRLSDFTFTFLFHALEKEMAIHSSILAWRIPGTVEPGGLPSMGSHRVRHDWSDLT